MNVEWINPKAAMRLALAVFGIAIVLTGVGVAVAFFGMDLSESALEFLAVVGVAVSLTAVTLALIIYARQEVSTDARFDEMADLVRVLPWAVEAPQSADEVEASKDVDVHPDDTQIAESAGKLIRISGHTDVRVLEPRNVPLSVLADLVIGWRHDGVGKDGNWTVGNLVGAARPTGKGNHPWYLLFEASQGEVVWRLYRGGRSKTVPTVTELQLT